jgi:hypothetical protein
VKAVLELLMQVLCTGNQPCITHHALHGDQATPMVNVVWRLCRCSCAAAQVPCWLHRGTRFGEMHIRTGLLPVLLDYHYTICSYK